MYWPKSKVQVVLTVLLTLAYLMTGVMKLSGGELVRQSFENWGYPVFFIYVIGLCEVAGAVGLWLRRFSYAAKVCLILLMAGAAGTHLVFDTFTEALAPVILIVLIAVTLALHHKERGARDDLMPA